MDRKYDIQLNLSPYANYFLDGGNTGGMTYTPEDNGFIMGSFSTDWTPQGISSNDAVLSDYQQKMVNRADTKQAIAEKGKGFLDKMNSSGGGGWANAIAPAATNIANAFLDTEASTADRVAGALGIPALANQWRADTSKGESYLKAMTSALDSMSGKNYIQDASSTFGANNAVKLNNKQIISPISPASALPSLKDFKGNWWRNMGASVAQGAASGSVGGPWGAAGGALTGFFGSLSGLFGRKKRAEKAYDDFLRKRDTLMSAQQNAFNTAVKNQTLSNMQALANGNMSQRINDMANIRAFGGNLFANGGSYIDPDPETITAEDIEKARLDAYYPNRLSDTFLGNPIGYLSEDAGLESYAPIIGTVQDWDKFVAEPTVGNAIWAGLSTISDYPWFKMGGIGLRALKRGWDAYNTYRKVAKALNKTKAVGEFGEAADALRDLRKVMPDPEYTQMRRQIIAPTRDKDVIEGVKDYYKHEGAKLASQLVKQFKKPLTYSDFAINFAQNQIGGGDNYIPEDKKILSNNGVVFSYNPSSRTWISENSGSKGEKIVVPAEEMQQNLQNGLGKVINNNTEYAMGGNLYPIGGTIREGDEEVDQEPVYEGGELPEITVSAESMPWYEKAWRKFDRNVLKYPKYAYNYFFPDKNKFIVLDDNTKINRVTDESSAFGNDYILSNEFVEKKNPNTIRTARDFQYPNQDTLLGDNYIPLGNISTYYGIENGKLKAGKASDFEDDTFIMPNRTKNVGKIREIQLPIEGEYDWGMPWSDERAEQLRLHNEFMELNESFVNQKKYAEELRRLFDKYYGMNNSTAKRAAALARKELKKNHKSEYDDYMADWNTRNKELLKKVTITEPKEGYVITENNDTLPIPNFNATPKMYFADENGNAAFVSGLKPNIEKVNDYLSEHPSYPIMVDNGRFKHIIEGDDINAYTGGYMNPEDNYIIGIKQKAMGGNLYTDLSPNMINLWNNKQQIDQQKAMNQQFSLGLGNSSFVNKFETGGPVDPPKEFMDVYHPDWGIYTPDYANMTFDEYKQKYGNPNDPDNFDYSPESYNSYQYRLYQPYPNNSTFGNSYLFRPEMNILNKKYPIENLPVYRDKKGDLYLKRGIKDLYGNNDVYIEGNTEDPTYNRRNKNGDLRITPHKDEWELGHTDKSVPRESFEAFKKSSEEQVLNELRRRAYDNEFYSYPEVQKYKDNNSKQKSNATTKKTANSTTTKSSSEKKTPSKATAKSANNIYNMTYQQMEDYYGQKQSPLLNAQYKNTWATGGQMTSLDVPDNMQYFANGGTHEENPYGGIQVGTDQQGTPNLVEEGEFRWNNFVFSDRINVDANLLSSFNLAPATKHQNKKAAKGKLSYADMAKKYAKRNKELENDPITKNSMEAFMQRLANAQEYQKKAEQLEAQKQNELQDYKTALNKQNNNPMYGTMKYNGMGNAATQQGVNSGVDAGMGNPMSNADLSNVNRSGNEMMAAYGGNLFAIGGKDDPNPYEWTLDNLNARQVLTPWNSNFIGPTLENSTNLGITPNADNYSWGNIDANTPFYQNEGWGIDMKPTYMKVKNPNYNAPAVSTYATRDKNGKIIYDPSGKPFMSYPRTYEGMKSSDYPNTKVIGKTVDNNGFYLNVPQYTPPAQGKVIQPEYEPDLSDYKAAYYKDFNSNGINTTPYVQNGIVRGNNGISNIPITASGINPIGVPSDSSNSIGDTNTVVTNPNNINTDSRIGKTTTNTNPDAAIPSDPKEAPLYSTAGKYAQFGKGIMPMVWDWANKTNVKYDPYQRDADRLEALANEGPSLRTADTIGGYRAPNLMDVERLNNSARAEGLAQMQAILDAANGNRGFVGAHSAQNNYNTQMGIGDNYVKTQEANNTNRLQTDQFNHGINVANQNAINAMYQDNQRAEQTQHQAALSGTAQAAALRQRENLHADEVNTERMKNRAANQAAYVDNALNYFTTQAMENQELNARNNDPTNPYWIDKDGRVHYTGDSGLTQAVRDAFGNDEYGRNGTFTGERLTEWNDLIKNKKYSAKYLKEHPELWEHLVAQQREANRIDAEKAKQAKLEELEALRGTYQSNLARLNALKDSGAIISDPSYNLYTGWADEDYSGNQGLLRTRNQALDQYITQIGNNYDRYLYEKQLAQNQAKALGGYLDDGQNNNNYYYSYTRI